MPRGEHVNQEKLISGRNLIPCIINSLLVMAKRYYFGIAKSCSCFRFLWRLLNSLTCLCKDARNIRNLVTYLTQQYGELCFQWEGTIWLLEELTKIMFLVYGSRVSASFQSQYCPNAIKHKTNYVFLNFVLGDFLSLTTTLIVMWCSNNLQNALRLARLIFSR